jgi:pyrimidine-nucleoside phosphorylase
MTPYEIISHKRDGKILSKSEIDFIIRGYQKGQIPDYQMAAFLMAIYFQGMNDEETRLLTDAFIHSGKIIDLKDLPGIKVDKHSTGGVGDKVSIILAPIVAAAGVHVPMISGRGLGHTGGTLDKLESIPGFKTDYMISGFRKILRQTGACLIGQTADLAPVDKKIYALRDVTATVPSIPLIAASIMSKKIAAGIDALVLDIKVGRGAFMPDPFSAQKLARVLIQIGKNYGKKISALLTDMNQPLGYAVGNWLEILECIECLRDRWPADLKQLTCRLAGVMFQYAGKTKTASEGEKLAAHLVTSGKAWEKFISIVGAQNGDLSLIQKPEKYRKARFEEEINANRSGWIQDIDALEIGLCAVSLGAGRIRLTDQIDPTAGIRLKVKRGEFVEAKQPLATLFTGRKNELPGISARVSKAFNFTDKQPATSALILKMISDRDV